MRRIGGRGAYVSVLALLLCAAGCTFDGGGIGGGAPAASPDAGGGGGALPKPDAGAIGEPDAAPGPMPGVLESHVASPAPDLDADLSDWDPADFRTFTMNDAAQLFGVRDGYSFDAQVRFASSHDADHLYFAFDVTDDQVIADSSLTYQDDAVELYLDGDGNMTGPYGQDDHWIVVNSGGLYQSLGPAEIAITGSAIETDSGYRIEIALDRADLNGSSGNDTVGFNVGLVDDDGLGNGDADAYGLWYANDADHCSDCCAEEEGPQAWCDTTLFGRLLLVQ